MIQSTALRTIVLQRTALRSAATASSVAAAAPVAAATIAINSRGIITQTGQQPFDTANLSKKIQQNASRSVSPSEIRTHSTLVLPKAQELAESPKHLYNRLHKDPQTLRRLSKPKFKSSDPYNNDHLPVLPVANFRNLSTNALSIYAYQRKIKSTKLSEYLELLQPETEEGTFSQVHRKRNKEHRPLVLMYPWLMAQDKHVEKYTRLYTDLGIDVLKVTIRPLALLNPVPRAQVAAAEVLEFLLEKEDFNKLFIHGMSVGGYGFMEVMTKMEQNEDRYLCIRSRFTGQVWDSPCDLPGLKEGVARSVTDNQRLQAWVMDALDWFLEFRYQKATRHYVKTQDMFHKNYLDAPALYLYSRADVVSKANINTDLADNWNGRGYQVFSKVFNESKHVGHYSKYKVEYKANIYAFLHHIGMLKYAGINLED